MYGPIGLTNYDYNILANILANRLQKVLVNIVNEDQSAYIKGRYIGCNAMLIQDILDYCEMENPEIILRLDFEMAFDSNCLGRPFMVGMLEPFNFGNKLIHWIKLLYMTQLWL